LVHLFRKVSAAKCFAAEGKRGVHVGAVRAYDKIIKAVTEAPRVFEQT